MKRLRRQTPFFWTRWLNKFRGPKRKQRRRRSFFGGRNRVVSNSRPPGGDDDVGAPVERSRPGLRLIAMIVIASLAFAIPVFGVQAYDYVMRTGHFFVKDVVVDGHELLSLDEVKTWTGIRANTHLLATDLEVVEARLRTHPWIAVAEVRKELPHRIHIEIVEQTPVAYLAAEEIMLVNRSGEPFATVEAGFNKKLPIITGLSLKDFMAKQTRDDARARARSAVNFSRRYEQMGLMVRWPIAEIQVSTERHITLVLSQSGTEVKLGEGPYKQKLYRLEWVLESLRQREQVADYILLDVADGTTDDGRVIVKAKVAPSARKKAREAAKHVITPAPKKRSGSSKKVTNTRTTPALRGQGRRRIVRKHRKSNRMLPRITRKQTPKQKTEHPR